jgi:hypothetical protein
MEQQQEKPQEPTVQPTSITALRPAPAPAARSNELDYQPVSGWAVAGLILGIAIAALVLGSFAISVYSGQPSFLPLETMVVGLAGMVVSFVGHREVLLSEGTRTGKKLASWGMWLSVISVLGFFAFKIATEQALYQQASAFLLIKDEVPPKAIADSGFFPRLIAGAKDPVESNRAFLLTIPSTSRAGNPANEKDMAMRYDVGTKDNKEVRRLTQFRGNPVLKFIEANSLNDADDSAITIEPIAGAKEFNYDSKTRSYQIKRWYRIKTPETTMDLNVQVNSEESPEPGVRRKWLVAMPTFKEEPKQATPLGKNLTRYRADLYAFLTNWAKTQPLGPPTLRDTTSYEKLFSGPLLREHAESRLKEIQVTDLMFTHPSQLMVSPWKMVDGKLRMFYPVQVSIAGRLSPIINTFQMRGFVTVESATPLDPHVPDTDTPQWNILSIEWREIGGRGPR